MATLASNVTWGSGPVITFDLSYEKKREGSSQYYKVTTACDPLSGSHYFGYPIYVEIKLDGSTKASYTLKSASPYQWTSAITKTTEWLEVPNKTEGTTGLTIRIYSGSGSDRTKTYNYTLAVDPAASKIGATDANIESASAISITKYDTNFTTTVSYKAAGQSSFTAIWTKEKHTSYAWTVPSSLYSLIPKAKEIDITLQCQTYSGSTLVGTETATMTAYASETKCKPTVSVSSEDANAESIALTGNKKYIVKGISNLKVVTTATAKNSATISSIKAYCGGKELSGSSVSFQGTESNSVYVIVTDSRGFSTRIDDKSLTLKDYIPPTITPTITRDTPTGDTVTVSVKGIWFNGSFGSIANTIKLKVKYKIDGAADYGAYYDLTVTKGSNEYTATVNLSGLPYTNAYRFQIRLDDEVYTDTKGYRDAKYVTNIYLSKGVPIFDWGESDFQFNVPVNFGGGIGNISAVMLTSSDDLDNIKTSGWYQWNWDHPPVNAPIDTGTQYMRSMRVWAGKYGECCQEVIDLSDSPRHGCMVRRTIYNDIVYPWEWVNPPMALGVEYRTTERFAMSPVYKKALSLGYVAAGNTLVVNHNIPDIGYPIECKLYDSVGTIIGAATFVRFTTSSVTITLPSGVSGLGGYTVYGMLSYTAIR